MYIYIERERERERYISIYMQYTQIKYNTHIYIYIYIHTYYIHTLRIGLWYSDSTLLHHLSMPFERLPPHVRLLALAILRPPPSNAQERSLGTCHQNENVPARSWVASEISCIETFRFRNKNDNKKKKSEIGTCSLRVCWNFAATCNEMYHLFGHPSPYLIGICAYLKVSLRVVMRGHGKH